MPLLQVVTNQAIATEKQQPFIERCSRSFAEALGKPERYVMVTLRQGEPMLFGGDTTPCVYLELKSIGLPEGSTADLSSILTSLMERELNIAADRIYIEFSDAQRHMWGWNGGTF